MSPMGGVFVVYCALVGQINVGNRRASTMCVSFSVNSETVFRVSMCVCASEQQ